MSSDHLPPPLDELAEKDRIHKTLDSKEVLFVQDSPTVGLFYLVTGTIDLKRVTRSGHAITIHRARAGDTFAEASIFSETYHCTATATCEAQLVLCKRKAITHLFKTNTNFANTMAARFAVQIQENRRRVELLSIRGANERILIALNDGLLVDDISSFAEFIGLSPETVYRSLAKLSSTGSIVKTARGEYQALD